MTSFRAPTNAATQASMSSSVCEAETCTRIRALSRGTTLAHVRVLALEHDPSEIFVHHADGRVVHELPEPEDTAKCD